MRTLYVVECMARNGRWHICDFAGEYCSTSFSEAQKMKKAIIGRLKHPSEMWRKSDFRVVKYGAL